MPNTVTETQWPDITNIRSQHMEEIEIMYFVVLYHVCVHGCVFVCVCVCVRACVCVCVWIIIIYT